jgi:hypothetical protein
MTRGMGGRSPANISHYLKGIDFPARKPDLVRHAKANGAEQAVLDVLENLPENEYQNMADVMSAVGEVE